MTEKKRKLDGQREGKVLSSTEHSSSQINIIAYANFETLTVKCSPNFSLKSPLSVRYLLQLGGSKQLTGKKKNSSLPNSDYSLKESLDIHQTF